MKYIRPQYLSDSSSDVRSPTRTSTEVRSPTRTATSTEAYTANNITVTGGAGSGATTVLIPYSRHRNSGLGNFLRTNKKPLLVGILIATAIYLSKK